MGRTIGRVVIAVLLVIGLADWVIGVKRVNTESYIPVQYFELNEPFYYGEVCYTAKEFHLYTHEEFTEAFGIDYSQERFAGDMLLLLEFSVKNASASEMELSQLLGNVGQGFESHTWSSSTDPFLCAEINRYASDTVQSGEEIPFYVGVSINKGSFSEAGWEKLYDTVFYYTMSVYPDPVRIRLGTPEESSGQQLSEIVREGIL